MAQPWQDGYWLFEDMKFFVKEVKGTEKNCSKKWVELDHPEVQVDQSKSIWTFGDFGEASPEIKEATGVENYNLEMADTNRIYVQKGVLSEDGKTITAPGPFGISTGKWLSTEALKALQDDRDDINDLPCPYPKQPEHQGKIIWLSGPPGVGKSCTAQFMAKHHGYVYLEGDAFISFVNPYFPLDAKEPSMELRNQKPLKGYSDESMKILLPGSKEWSKIMKCMDYDEKLLIDFYREMAKFVLKEKQRMGGNWVVAQAVPTRSMREGVKEILGDQCTFVTLQLSEEANAKRVAKRFDNANVAEHLKKMASDIYNKMFKLFEPAGEDEINLDVDPDMDVAQVSETILKMTS